MRDHVECETRERKAGEKQHQEHEQRHAPDVQPAEQLVERSMDAVPGIGQRVLQPFGEVGAD